MASFDGSLVDIHCSAAPQAPASRQDGHSPDVSETAQAFPLQATYSLLDLDIFENVEPGPSRALAPPPPLKPLSATATEHSTLLGLSQAVEGMRVSQLNLEKVVGDGFHRLRKEQEHSTK